MEKMNTKPSNPDASTNTTQIDSAHSDQKIAPSLASSNILHDITTTKQPIKNEASMEIALTKTPEITISTGTDWVAFLGFAITALIVFATTRQTIKNSEKLIKSQEDLSILNSKETREAVKCELTANNRQAWINTLRSDLADYIATIAAIWDLHQMKEGREEVLRANNNTEHALRELFEWSLAYHKAIQESEKLLAKIKLLTNPSEEKTQKLTEALEVAFITAKTNKHPTDACNNIIRAAQPILKEEWERVKSMK